MKRGITVYILIAFGLLLACNSGVSEFEVPSGANEPTIKEGSTILVSRQRQPNRFDFICFNNEVEGMGNFVAVFRVCGVEDDVIEIRNGDLYVNGKMSDDKFSLQQLYKMPLEEFNRIANQVNANEAVTNKKKDSVSLFLSSAFVEDHQVKCNRVLLPENQKDEDIARVFHENWNPDHFGPVLVPKGNYFVLGDNRRHAADSRYLGFIPKEKWVGTVILK